VQLELIDTHAHLDDESFRTDLPALIERARAVGVERVITIATTARSSADSIALAARFDSVFASVGIQPNHVAEAQPTDWDFVVRSVRSHKVVAVGETGLDRHWDKTPFREQEDYFDRHLHLSRTHSLPVVIHCREAEADVLRMLREDFDKYGPIRGVMHSFTGDLQSARTCLEMGLYISFAGMLTYKNAQNLRDVAREIPANRLLVETDIPYLAPEPCRGRRNEPANIIHTLECLALTLGMDASNCASQTTRNARHLFEGIG
jgi:TatD DNase family protein